MRLYLLVGILLKGCNFLPHCLLIRPSLSGSTCGFLFHCLSHTPCLYHFDAHVFPGSAARSPFRGLPRPLTCPHGSECLFVCFRKAASGALSSSCTFPPSALLSKKPGSFSVDSEKPKSGHTKTHTHLGAGCAIRISEGPRRDWFLVPQKGLRADDTGGLH